MKILLAGEITAWRTNEVSRFNQVYRNELAEYLKIVANSIANNGASEGAVGGIRWRLEPSIAEPIDDEPADDEPADEATDEEQAA
jgi:hypothetical protein